MLFLYLSALQVSNYIDQWIALNKAAVQNTFECIVRNGALAHCEQMLHFT